MVEVWVLPTYKAASGKSFPFVSLCTRQAKQTAEMVVVMLSLSLGPSVLPEGPTARAITLFWFYFVPLNILGCFEPAVGHTAGFSGLRGRRSWAACHLVTLQPETPALATALLWHFLSCKERQKGEMAKGSARGVCATLVPVWDG